MARVRRDGCVYYYVYTNTMKCCMPAYFTQYDSHNMIKKRVRKSNLCKVSLFNVDCSFPLVKSSFSMRTGGSAEWYKSSTIDIGCMARVSLGQVAPEWDHIH